MDIFSNIKNVQNITYDSKYLKNENNVPKIQKMSKAPEMQNKKEPQSVEEIKKKLENLTEQLNNEISPLNKDLEFKYNQKIDNFMVLVIDKKTNKVIREFPFKEALKLMEKMRELVGMLFDKKG